ncbi:CopG family transcriptional regulator [Cyanobium sp. Cruz CV11-17]|uniref:CopG family transcriptional regulator n=2 Tax=unclassified Cyanobium TaxID=2627006 RepID=UPI0020CEE3DB|nr:CopG family transcriptional regulator [Cyanobium sp. Cruz CV11-17]
MRTTLQLDDDMLAAARVLARQQRTSLDAVISELARQALVAPAPGSSSGDPGGDHRNGLPLLPWKEKGAPVDLELVNHLRDELAAHRGGRLVSFDRRLSGEGIAGGREALWLIEA